MRFPIKICINGENCMTILRYSSRLSLHSRVPFTSTYVFQFYSKNQSELACHTRVILCALHSSHTSSATCESDKACCTRVGHGVLHTSQISCAARESDFVCCTRVIVRILHMYHSKLNTKHANESK